MGRFNSYATKKLGYSTQSMKERDFNEKRLADLEEQKLSAAAVEDYALALKRKEEIAAIHRNEAQNSMQSSFADIENPFRFPEEFDHDHDPEFLPEWIVKLPVPICWDESDDGVPPPCRGEVPVEFWKVFNHHNRFTNDNLVMIAFGNVGFKYFDKHRKFWMGLAMWSTLISIAFTVAGCFALSTDQDIVINTNWVYIEGIDNTNDNEEVFMAHLGLRSLVYTASPCTPLECETKSYRYDGAIGLPNRGVNDWPNDFIEHGINECRESLNGTAFGAFTTCITLVFALIGTINRMKFSSDANIQKALGMITDLCGFVSLSITLFGVFSNCVGEIDETYGDIEIRVYMGPGYYCYCVCLFGAMMRAIFHWVTPLPGRGSGCTPRLPKSLLKKLDLHHSHQHDSVSWDELRNAYRQFVKRVHEEKRHRKEHHLKRHSLSFVVQPGVELNGQQPMVPPSPVPSEQLDRFEREIANELELQSRSGSPPTRDQDRVMVGAGLSTPKKKRTSSLSNIPEASSPVKGSKSTTSSNSSSRGASADRDPLDVEKSAIKTKQRKSQQGKMGQKI